MARSTRSSAPAAKKRQAPAAPTSAQSSRTIKLQIAAGVFVPMLALGLWLNSKGFFG
jgi:hypothetical protein